MSAAADLGTAAHLVLEETLGLMQLGLTEGLTDAVRERIGEEITIEDTEHARLSPSGAKRWMACPASVKMSEGAEPLEGPRSYVFDAEYADAVITCLEYVQTRVRELAEEYPGAIIEVAPERRVSPARYLTTRDCDGTVDITILVIEQGTLVFIEIVDFKTGYAVPVYPDDPQLKLYLLGVLAEVSAGQCFIREGHRVPESARLTICQPRCPQVDDIQSESIAPVAPVMTTFTAETALAIAAVDAEDPAFNPGPEACRFCPGKSRNPPCKHHVDYAMSEAGIGSLPDAAAEFVDLGASFAAQDPHVLTQEQIRGLLDIEDMLLGSFKAIREVAQNLLWNGEASPVLTEAYKLARSQSRLTFEGGEEDTAKALKRIPIVDPESGKGRKLGKKDLYVQRLRSAPQIRDLLTKHFQIPKDDARMDAFWRLTHKPEGNIVLAPISDPRAAVPPRKRDPEDAFGGTSDDDAPQL